MISFENEHGIVEKPNVKMLYEIVHDYVGENDISTMDFISLMEMMKYESITGTYKPDNDEEDDDDEI